MCEPMLKPVIVDSKSTEPTDIPSSSHIAYLLNPVAGLLSVFFFFLFYCFFFSFLDNRLLTEIFVDP